MLTHVVEPESVEVRIFRFHVPPFSRGKRKLANQGSPARPPSVGARAAVPVPRWPMADVSAASADARSEVDVDRVERRHLGPRHAAHDLADTFLDFRALRLGRDIGT